MLAGRIFDDRGNRMTPSHVRKRGIKYRYYLSSALLQGQAQNSGSVSRIPATDIEALVIKSVRDHLKPSEPIDDRSLVTHHVERIEIQQEHLIIQLTGAEKSTRRQAKGANTLQVPWHKTPATRRREMLLPASVTPQQVRPIRSETRATLIASIARGRRWLNELIDDATSQRRKHRQAREVQRTPGQYDDIARLPCAHSCEGRDRRSTATRHRRHPIARCTCRVVSPTRDARSGWLTRPGLCRPHTRSCGHRNCLPTICPMRSGME